MAYAPSEQKYMELYSQFKSCAPSTVVEYFNQNWHPIRKQWTMGMKYSTGYFLNGTNNRLESLNAKLKSVISRYSSLEEFVDKFFLVLRVLRSERDHAASLTAQKQCRLLRSAIGNFPGQKVTCPVISNIGLTECPDDSRPRMQAPILTNACARSRPRPFTSWSKDRLTMKRGCEAAESDASGPSKKPKRRQVSLTTFTKWQAQLEREHQTMTWLRCDSYGQK